MMTNEPKTALERGRAMQAHDRAFEALRAKGAEHGVDIDAYETVEAFASAIAARITARESERIAIAVVARGKGRGR